MTTSKIAVIGGGSWATALAKVMLESKDEIYWYMRSEESRNHILRYGYNPHYISSVRFDASRIRFTESLDETVAHADVLILAVPSAFVHEVLKDLHTDWANKTLVSGVKGIIPQTGETVSQYVHREKGLPERQFVVASGPTHAEEIAMQRISQITVACKDAQIRGRAAATLAGDYLKVFPSADVLGIEYAATLKNIYSIAAGMIKGQDYGDNILAIFTSYALREMQLFINKIVGGQRNIMQAAYLGDLLVTAYSQHSRNRLFGTMLGKGYSLKAILLEMNMVAEGYYAADSIYKTAQEHAIKVPALEFVYNVIHDHKPIADETKNIIDTIIKN